MRELGMILRKELIHIFRDRVSFFLVLAMPIALVLLFGFTISSEIRNARISVLDRANDSQSHRLLEKLTASGYFRIVSLPHNEAEIDSDFKNKGIKMAVIIPSGFEEALSKEKTSTLQVINDVSDLNVAYVLNNYLRAVVHAFSADIGGQEGLGPGITTKMQYNPESDSVYMFVPGVITLVMILVTALMTSITLAREKETGSMRMLQITPVRNICVVIGKVVPYMIISFVSTVLILAISVSVFKMPVNGSLLFLLFLCVVFMLTAASFGMMISAIVNTQLDAMMFTMMGLFLPTVLLSGFLFPLENMPAVFQWMADVFPAKWFILAIKDVMVKGSGFADIWQYLLILFSMAVVLIAVSLSRLDRRR